jgi:anti-anti-sigma factor
MNSLQVSLSRSQPPGTPARITCRLEGHLDNATVSLLQPQLAAALAEKPAELVFDLAALRYVTSAGLHQFLHALRQQKLHGGLALFVHPSPPIQEVFRLLGPLPDLHVFPDLPALEAFLARRQAQGQQQQ